MSIDPAYSEEQHDKRKHQNDPAACTVWGYFQTPRLNGKSPIQNIMLLDAWEEWLQLPDLVEKVKRDQNKTYGDSREPEISMLPKRGSDGKVLNTHQGRRPDLILIEEKASGKSLIHYLHREGISRVRGYNPTEPKLVRLNLTSLMFHHHRVWMLESSLKYQKGEFVNWAEGLISQLCTYVGKNSTLHDDLMDSATQALLHIEKWYEFQPYTKEHVNPEDADIKRPPRNKQRRLTYPQHKYPPPPPDKRVSKGGWYNFEDGSFRSD